MKGDTAYRFKGMTREQILEYVEDVEARLLVAERSLTGARAQMLRLIAEKYALKAQLPKPKREARLPIPEHKKQEVLELGRTTVLCVREIAERTGVSPTSVYRLLHVPRNLGTERAAGD